MLNVGCVGRLKTITFQPVSLPTFNLRRMAQGGNNLGISFWEGKLVDFI
jgi:hypothetical protein